MCADVNGRAHGERVQVLTGFRVARLRHLADGWRGSPRGRAAPAPRRSPAAFGQRARAADRHRRLYAQVGSNYAVVVQRLRRLRPKHSPPWNLMSAVTVQASMRKALQAMFTLLLLAGCGDAAPSESRAEPEKSTVAAPRNEPLEPGDLEVRHPSPSGSSTSRSISTRGRIASRMAA